MGGRIRIDGEDYAVTLDGSALFATLAQTGAQVTVSPVELTLTDDYVHLATKT